MWFPRTNFFLESPQTWGRHESTFNFSLKLHPIVHTLASYKSNSYWFDYSELPYDNKGTNMITEKLELMLEALVAMGPS